MYICWVPVKNIALESLFFTSYTCQIPGRGDLETSQAEAWKYEKFYQIVQLSGLASRLLKTCLR